MSGSKECSNNCKECGSECSERREPKKLIEESGTGSQIKKVIGVVSGKGGVGKSLVTSLLTASIREKGHSVAVLDADITGPSIPKMFGLFQKAKTNENGIFPVESGHEKVPMQRWLEVKWFDIWQKTILKILWIFRNLTDSAIHLELIYHQIMNMFLNEIWQNYLDKRCSMWVSFI